MMRLRRILVILMAYLSGAIVGSLVLSLILILVDQQSFWSLRDFAKGVGIFAYLAATIGLPVTVPVIAMAEIDPRTSAPVCLIGGLLLGLLMGLVVGMGSFRLEPIIISIIASVSGAAVYWLVAWKAFAPDRTQTIGSTNSKGSIA